MAVPSSGFSSTAVVLSNVARLASHLSGRQFPLFAQNRMHRRQQRHTALVIPCTCMDRWIGCVDCDIVRSRNWGARKWAGTPECQY
jgi:hypothetical protein